MKGSHRQRKSSRRDFLKSTAMTACSAGLLSLLPACTTAKRSAGRRPPNFLFVLSDQHRYDWTSCSDRLAVRTPNLERLAARGVRFTNAIVASPLCGPSRACLASGKQYQHAGVRDHRMDYPIAQPTYYAMLRDTGYHVAGCGKMDLHKSTLFWGEDGSHLLHEWGFSDGVDNAGKWNCIQAIQMAGDIPLDPYSAFLKRRGLHVVHYVDFMRRWFHGSEHSGLFKAAGVPRGLLAALQHETIPKSSRIHPYPWLLAAVGIEDARYQALITQWRAEGGDAAKFSATFPTPLPDDAYCDNWVAENALQLLAHAPSEKPWHLVVNFTGPHEPMDVTDGMAALYRGVAFPGPHRNTQLTPAGHVAIRRNYSAMVENIDRWLGVLMDAVAQRGELDNTVIVYASDHGEMLGDHNLWAKQKPYHPSIAVPLLVSGPGMREGLVCHTPVSMIDIGATFLDYAGVRRPADMDSRSLRPILEGKTNRIRRVALSALCSRAGMRRGETLYAAGSDPQTLMLSGHAPWQVVYDGRYKLITRPPAADGDAIRVGYPLPDILFDLQNDPMEDCNIAEDAPDIVRRLAAWLI